MARNKLVRAGHKVKLPSARGGGGAGTACDLVATPAELIQRCGWWLDQDAGGNAFPPLAEPAARLSAFDTESVKTSDAA